MGILTFAIDGFTNSPPDAIGDNTIAVNNDSTYTFTQANFTTETDPPYSDPEGDVPSVVKVLTLPATGTLQYNAVNVNANDELSWSGIGTNLFTYIAPASPQTAYNDTWTFDIKDVGSNTLSGLTGTITMAVQAYVNQPPTVGNNATTFVGANSIAHGAEVTITTAHLTTDTSPAYSDPEGDGALLLRVNVLPADGELLLNGIPVVAGQVITFTDIGNSLLTYRAARDVYTQRTRTFEFDIQDSGSGQWST